MLYQEWAGVKKTENHPGGHCKTSPEMYTAPSTTSAYHTNASANADHLPVCVNNKDSQHIVAPEVLGADQIPEARGQEQVGGGCQSSF